jgi:CheY-like chemotaxis protein
MPNKPLSAEAQAQACQAQRMEIVGQLTGGILHDFNNVLTVITGTIEILAEAVADRPELAAIARLMDQAAARGADLAAHLLAFARDQPSPPREVDVNALLLDAARLLRPTLGGQIEICSMPATDVPVVRVDPSRLMTAILDLAIAARDATPQGDRLILECRSVAAGESYACAGREIAAADYVAIAVSVAGSGDSDRRPDRSFADIGRTREFVEQTKGHVEVRREAGCATSVEIYLPRAASQVRPPAQDKGNAGIAGGSEAVLIVEDDALVRKYIITQVRSLGYRTLAAGNASEALAIIDAGGKIDLLFTDVMMPGSINGRQLALEALKRRPLLKILYTSGYSEDAMFPDSGFDADTLLLAKPYRKLDLAKMIRTALVA